MRRTAIASMAVYLAASLAAAADAATYQAVTVADGGTISGTITYGGTPPHPKPIKVTKDNQACGTEVPDEALVVGAEKGIKNVVVWITDIKMGKKWNHKAVLDQKKCYFQPHVVVAEAGANVEILNSDGILHNIHTYSKANPPINVPQPKFKPKMTQKFSKPERFRFECDAHPWMRGYLVVSDHPYVAVTDEKGTYRLTDVPPGDYKVEIWHETLGKTQKTVKVAARTDAPLNHTFPPKP